MKGPFDGFRPKNYVVPPGAVRVRGPLVSPFRPGTSSASAMRAYGENSILFPIVSRLALDTSNSHWRLWMPGPSGEDDDRTQVRTESNPVSLLWSKPNKFMTTQNFMEASQQHLDLTGETDWLVVRKPSPNGLPIELWPIMPNKLQPVPDIEGDNFLLGWIYTGPDNRDYGLQPSEVIQLKMPNPYDPYRGLGPVQASMLDLETDKWTAEWNRNFFINGAEPGGVITTDSNLDDDDFNRIMLRWRESHQGANNAHRVAILEAGLQWENNSMSQKDMQFQELRQQSADRIRQAFGFPEFMLGNLQNANRAAAQASMDMYDATMIDPRCKRFKQALNSWLLPMFGTNNRALYFDYDPVVNADEESEASVLSVRAQAASTLILAGFDRMDVCAVVGLPQMQTAEGMMNNAASSQNDPSASDVA